MRERVIPFFMWENMYKIGIRRVKIKGRKEDRWKVTLRLRVIERWKSKREVMIGSSREKWEIDRWCSR